MKSKHLGTPEFCSVWIRLCADFCFVLFFFIFAQSSMKVDESITVFIFVSNYSCSIFALLGNVTTHNLMYFISMCSSMGLFFFHLN